MNFSNPTAAEKFASLVTLVATVTSSSSLTLQRPPDASNPLTEMLVESDCAEISAAEVITPHLFFNITDDTHAIGLFWGKNGHLVGIFVGYL